MLPLNSITSKIWYTTDNSQNMRVLVSAVTENPIAWTISKIENINLPGILTVTLYQDSFNPYTDYVDLETGEMFADYYDPVLPIEPDVIKFSVSDTICVISASTDTIKAGGSYKLLTASFYNKSGLDDTDEYAEATLEWTCSIDGEDCTDTVIWLEQTDFNKIKIKFPNDKQYLNRVLIVNCTMGDVTGMACFKITV